MLTDPQSVTVAGTAISLPRTGENGTLADYTSADGLTSLRVQQSINKSTRRTSILLRTTKVAADAITGLNSRITSTISANVTSPLDGFSALELKDQFVALATLLTATSGSTMLRVLGGEK